MIFEGVFYSPTTGAFTGLRVGNHSKGYLQATHKGTQVGLHRLAFTFMGEEIPKEVDHINGDKKDNRWENLRAVSRQQNSRNHPLHSNNTTGQVGVSWCSAANKWRARITGWDKKERHLGVFADMQEAIQIRKEAEIQYGYHDNHGRKRAMP